MAGVGQGDRWRLDGDTVEHHEPEVTAEPAAPVRDRSRERLERAVHVVTAEHLGWVAIAAYALPTRLAALGARPLDSIEASHALYAFDRASPGAHAAAGYYPASAGWIHLLTVWFFEFAGANDFTARIVFALSGLLLVAMAFVMRRYVGRAGGLALAAMLALSPSITWFSRASATALPAAAMMLVTLTAFMELKARPNSRRAAIMGLCAGLMIAANPIGLVAAVIFSGALIPFGLWNLVAQKNAGLATRVWLDRYAKLPVIVIAVAAVTCGFSQSMVPDGWNPDNFSRGTNLFIGGRAMSGFFTGIASGIRFHLPVLTLYEFMIAIAGLLGTVTIVAFRFRSRFAWWSFIWMAMSIAFWLCTPARSSEAVLALLVPMAVVGAIGIDRLHHSNAWRLLRIPAAGLAVLTLYVSLIANFVWAAPDASEAPWARHANLFWGANATTDQARLYTHEAAAGIPPAEATVFFDGDIAAPLRWYLRGLRPLRAADLATVVVSSAPMPPAGSPAQATYHFDYAEGWLPNFHAVRIAELTRFVLGGRIWGTVTANDATIMVRKLPADAPTAVLTPAE